MLDIVVTPEIALVGNRSFAGNPESATPFEHSEQGQFYQERGPAITSIGKVFVFEDGQRDISEVYAGKEDGNDSEEDGEDNLDWEDNEIVVYDGMGDRDHDSDLDAI